MNLQPPKNIRHEIRHARRLLSRAQQQCASLRLCFRILQSPHFTRARRLGVYLPNDGEISITPLIHQALKQGKKCYLPIVNSDQKLSFREYKLGARLRPNKYKIPEPEVRAKTIKTCQLDLVLAPLVAFDKHCHRMGMGGGYYDRTFARESFKYNSRPTLIGVAHNLQQVVNIEVNPWDIAMNAIATDCGWVK